MKKTSIARACLALLLVVGSTAHASATACPTLEFAELQTYTDKELMTMWSENFQKMVDIGPANMEEFQNCDTQTSRLARIMKARKEAQKAQATPTAK